MQLIKCENGHIYNAEKFRSCPHCSKIEPAGRQSSDTFGRNQADIETAMADKLDADEVRFFASKKTVGLLVVTEGEMCGAGFLIKEGKNSVGRSSNMDVALTAEPTISRKQHAVIEYRDGEYILSRTDEEKVILVNGMPIGGEIKLSDRDNIRLGDCGLTFIEAGSIWLKEEMQ